MSSGCTTWDQVNLGQVGLVWIGLGQVQQRGYRSRRLIACPHIYHLPFPITNEPLFCEIFLSCCIFPYPFSVSIYQSVCISVHIYFSLYSCLYLHDLWIYMSLPISVFQSPYSMSLFSLSAFTICAYISFFLYTPIAPLSLSLSAFTFTSGCNLCKY